MDNNSSEITESFVKFLKDNRIVSMAIAAILSDKINNLVDSFTENIIIPILEIDNNKDGKGKKKGRSEAKNRGSKKSR